MTLPYGILLLLPVAMIGRDLKSEMKHVPLKNYFQQCAEKRNYQQHYFTTTTTTKDNERRSLGSALEYKSNWNKSGHIQLSQTTLQWSMLMELEIRRTKFGIQKWWLWQLAQRRLWWAMNAKCKPACLPGFQVQNYETSVCKLRKSLNLLKFHCCTLLRLRTEVKAYFCSFP